MPSPRIPAGRDTCGARGECSESSWVVGSARLSKKLRDRARLKSLPTPGGPRYAARPMHWCAGVAGLGKGVELRPPAFVGRFPSPRFSGRALRAAAPPFRPLITLAIIGAFPAAFRGRTSGDTARSAAPDRDDGGGDRPGRARPVPDQAGRSQANPIPREGRPGNRFLDAVETRERFPASVTRFSSESHRPDFGGFVLAADGP